MFGRSAAQNPQTNPAKLARLARSSDAVILLAIASNPSTPSEVLDTLAHSQDWLFNGNFQVAGNPSTSPQTLQYLATVRDGLIRKTLASNPFLPGEMLTIDFARYWEPNLIGRSQKYPAPGTRLDAIIPSVWSNRVLTALADNPSTPAKTLAELATEKNADIALALAKNPATPSDALSKLWSAANKDQKKNIGLHLARNLATPSTVRAELLEYPEYRDSILHTWPLEGKDVRVDLARNPGFSEAGPKKIHTLLLHDPEVEVRIAIALSRMVSPEILSLLIHDASPAVAITAKARSITSQTELQQLVKEHHDPNLFEAIFLNEKLPKELPIRTAKQTSSDLSPGGTQHHNINSTRKTIICTQWLIF